ncbi:hypothetical protein CKJ70_25635 [Mycobacterium avium]|uniref:Uncharacterized protein n=3 Tax=Mycobacterium avium TaxID=1764 RepID=A0AAI8X2P6_MYCAV|nr:hypothetical protein CKJ70_25635 [Mycobacterium avium]BBN50744.1 hypothetical protein JPH1_52190 [Mycobacterium avium subsp. hominissuis]
MTIRMTKENSAVAAEARADIMIACDDLYCDPFDAAARNRVQALISRGAPVASTIRSETTSTSRAKGEHAMSPSASDRTPSADDDYAVVREFSRELKIACDELHDNPFDDDAREVLRTLLAERGPVADAALDRLSAQSSTQSSCRNR